LSFLATLDNDGGFLAARGAPTSHTTRISLRKRTAKRPRDAKGFASTPCGGDEAVGEVMTRRGGGDDEAVAR
jgi:hypothetical protein